MVPVCRPCSFNSSAYDRAVNADCADDACDVACDVLDLAWLGVDERKEGALDCECFDVAIDAAWLAAAMSCSPQRIDLSISLSFVEAIWSCFTDSCHSAPESLGLKVRRSKVSIVFPTANGLVCITLLKRGFAIPDLVVHASDSSSSTGGSGHQACTSLPINRPLG
eukprot:1552200-Rhodomonas_salina.2